MSGVSVGPIQSYVEGSTWFDLTKYSNFGVQERVSINLTESNLWLVDSSKLFLTNDYAPRVAFLNEGAGYQSPISLTASGATNGTATVFENLSGTNSILPNSNGPLEVGDWVQLSEIAGGTQLDLAVTPNGVFNPNARALSTDTSLNPTGPNPDAPVYWAAYADPSAENPLLIMGYEDIAGAGSDNDYNDGILAIDVGRENFESILSTANLGQDSSASLANAQAVPFELESSIGLVGLLAIFGLRYCFQMRRNANRILPG